MCAYILQRMNWFSSLWWTVIRCKVTRSPLYTGRNISFIYVWMLSQPCLNTQFQLLSAAIQLPSEIAKKFIHVWILFTQLNLTIQLSYAWHRLFMQLILRRVNRFSACHAISCETSRHQRISLLFHTSLNADKIEKYGNTERFDNFTDQVRPICQKVILLNTGQSDEGGFLGPMISDVRDYYIDNFCFPAL